MSKNKQKHFKFDPNKRAVIGPVGVKVAKLFSELIEKEMKKKNE